MALQCQNLTRRYWRMAWLLFCGLCLAGRVPASEHLSDHEQVCLSQSDCHAFLQQQLGQTAPGSAKWYKLQSYLLDFYFDKHRFTELRQLAEQLLALPDNPVVLQAQLYFYYGKVLYFFGQPELAAQYVSQASVKLADLFEGFGDPLRLIELANLQLTLGQTEQAELTLLNAEGRYSKSRDPIFLFELYSNKALVEDRRQQLQYAAVYRQHALDAVLTTGHSGKIVVALGNLARTRQLQGQYLQARQLYLQALPYFTAEQNTPLQAVYLLRLAELCWQLQDQQQSWQYLQKVQLAQLSSDSHRQLYQQLKQWGQSH